MNPTAMQRETGPSIVLRPDENADAAIDRILASHPEADAVVWQSGRIIAVIRAERGGRYPEVIEAAPLALVVA